MRCSHREWVEDDEVLPTGDECSAPAKWLSCTPYINTPVCEVHRCRCHKPILVSETVHDARNGHATDTKENGR